MKSITTLAWLVAIVAVAAAVYAFSGLILAGFVWLTTAVLNTALVVGTGFVLIWFIVGPVIGEVARYQNQALWDRHMNKIFWLTWFAGSAWAAYSIAVTANLWYALLSCGGLLLFAAFVGLLFVAKANSMVRSGDGIA